jgi:hypothetical protein
MLKAEFWRSNKGAAVAGLAITLIIPSILFVARTYGFIRF